MTDDTFAPPADFGLERYLAGSFGLFRGRPVTVALRFSRSVARYVAERQWHPSQQAAPHLTGELDLTRQVPICPELTRWILSYGKEVEVLAPPALRAAIRTEWLAALRRPGGRVEPAPPAAKPLQAYRIPAEEAVPTAEGPAARPRRSPHSIRPQK